jgi:hypothetical protein
LVALVVGLAAVTTVGAAVTAPVGAAGQADIPVIPVHGKAIGNGVRLYIDVFYARGGNPGPPGSGGGGGSVDCTDTGQGNYAPRFALDIALTFRVSTNTIPTNLSFGTAFGDSVSTWNAAGAHLSVGGTTSKTAPNQDGENTVGFARLVPKNVLAATWTYVDDDTGQVLEADMFFNSTNPWATLGACNGTATGNFDVADIATHELGHALGLNHYSDANAQATMYPSAPRDEVRKRTLSQGDVDALKSALP